MSKLKAEDKPFEISKWLVWDAYKKVKANKGAPGVDGQAIEQFEQDLENNLYRLWNRLSSGTYFPPPVKAVEIPKPGGRGVRVLGIPSVSDRIAQTAAAMVLERKVEPIFHPDSYGYRPGRSALDAVGMCRERCWKYNWAIDLDVQAFFDNVDHNLLVRAVERHLDTATRWVLLYVKRWLVAPLQTADGTLQARDRGTPQGSAISPVLANLFMHYAFDTWLSREHPRAAFERYCDDAVVHCVSQGHAERVLADLTARMAEVGLQLHPAKTRIVLCQDARRPGAFEHTSFTFLGYTFRPRLAKNREGAHFVGFTPAVSRDALISMGRVVRFWHLGRRSDLSLNDLAAHMNPVLRGWIHYYGRYYKSALYPLLQRINDLVVRWACRKFKRFRRRPKRARAFLVGIARREPELFAHWAIGIKPSGSTMGAV